MFVYKQEWIWKIGKKCQCLIIYPPKVTQNTFYFLGKFDNVIKACYV